MRAPRLGDVRRAAGARWPTTWTPPAAARRPRCCAATRTTPVRRGWPSGSPAASTGWCWPVRRRSWPACYPTTGASGGPRAPRTSWTSCGGAATRCGRCSTALRRPTRSAARPRWSAACCGSPSGGGCPVRLFEIGSSGGLNLQADRFRVTGGAERRRRLGRPGEPGRARAGLDRCGGADRRTAGGGRARRVRRPPRRRHHRGRPAHADVVRLARHGRPACPAGRRARRSPAAGRCRSSAPTRRRTSRACAPSPAP